LRRLDLAQFAQIARDLGIVEVRKQVGNGLVPGIDDVAGNRGLGFVA
jgi:hypothetical protein